MLASSAIALAKLPANTMAGLDNKRNGGMQLSFIRDTRLLWEKSKSLLKLQTNIL